MFRLVARVEDALQAAAGAERIEDAGKGVDGRAQAKRVTQVDHALKLWCPGAQWNERQSALVEGIGHLLPVLAKRNVQQFQQLFTVETASRMGAATVE
ncbi:hypothetical protein D3C80_1638990 [compost metagenome]